MNDVLWLDHEDDLWPEILGQAATFHTYHLPAYHRLAEMMGEGVARLFVYHEGDHFVALPLLVRPIVEPLGLENGTLWDATSVYGYPGPIVSAAAPPSAMLGRFREALASEMAERRIVTLFSRLNPLLDQVSLVEGLGDVVERGATVSIDLRLPSEQQLGGYRADHRYNIKLLKRLGYVCESDPEFHRLDTFVAIYHETMHRVGARDYYLFDEVYFQELTRSLRGHLDLVVCRKETEIVAATLFLSTNGVVHTYLSGTRTAALRQAPMKLLLETARGVFEGRGDAILHLGGGGGKDALFNFKAGFSRRRHPFHTWQWIVLPEIHEELCRARGRDPKAPVVTGFFPLYREP